MGLYKAGHDGRFIKVDDISNVIYPVTKLVLGDAGVDGGFCKSVDSQLRVVSTSYYDQISQGNVSGHKSFTLEGYVTGIPDAVFRDVSELGVNTIPVPSSAAVVYVTSTSVNDTAAGTGAQAVEVYGLDASYNEINEVVVTNGTTEVATTQNFFRINYIHNETIGSGLVAAGDITISTTGKGTIYSVIKAGYNNSQELHYTVPAGKTAYVTAWGGGATKKEVRIALFATYDRWSEDLIAGNYLIHGNITMKEMSVTRHLEFPLKFGEKTDIKVSIMSLGTTDAEGSAFVELYYE